jgi:catechol 2,3-dioxygenase-like lactoylglutathione lyase family enzyme
MMRFHHMAVMVSNLEAAIALWRDVLGFEIKIQCDIPDGPSPGPDTLMYPALLDDIFKIKGAHSRMALLSSADGALIELQECLTPKIQKTPEENLRYAHTGFHELGLLVEDIDGWYAKIRAAGYRMQTEYVWTCASLGRSFLFYDQDGNMIQLWEASQAVGWG